MNVHHRFATVRGHQIFYREAGAPDAPALVLLHGYPTSSFMFRNLIPALADRYRVIAPDYLGFGQSDAPSVADFDYTFNALTDLTADLLGQLGVASYAIYVQDYGAPVGWRLALRSPESITAIITQNGNGYEAGFVSDFWDPIWEFTSGPAGADEGRVAATVESIRRQYVHGEPDPTLLSPDTWTHDFALIQRPGNDLIQLALLRDYPTNRPLYPRLHEYFRDSQIPLLAVWGRNDEIFGPAGARAFGDDLPGAEVNLLDGGHFVLESHLDEVASLIRTFLSSALPG
jgi:pimeloyl-ACP methyl ester carboxylesterase